MVRNPVQNEHKTHTVGSWQLLKARRCSIDMSSVNQVIVLNVQRGNELHKPEPGTQFLASGWGVQQPFGQHRVIGSASGWCVKWLFWAKQRALYQ